MLQYNSPFSPIYIFSLEIRGQRRFVVVAHFESFLGLIFEKSGSNFHTIPLAFVSLRPQASKKIIVTRP